MKIDLDTRQGTLQIDGVTISLDLLCQLVRPKQALFYRIRREGDVVTMSSFTRSELMAHLLPELPTQGGGS